MKVSESPASDVSHALATFGLRTGASEKEIKRRYRKLVKQWHPDRFASDPQGYAEATQRLRLINRAYETLCSERPGLAWPVQTRDHRDSSGDDLGRVPYAFSREQIDEIIAALGHRDSFMDQLRADPWNRVTFLVVAVAEFVFSMWAEPLGESLPVRAGALPVVSAFLSVAVAPFIWSLERTGKTIGWSIYLMFTIGLPIFAYVIVS